jgi:hypothetical protein
MFHDSSDALTIQVYFHQDLPYLRCEIFDAGLFLTYYLGKEMFAETLQFERNTHPYNAYSAHLDLTRQYARRAATFAPTSPSLNLIQGDDALAEWLRTLGCQESLDQLRRARDARIKRLNGDLKTARIPKGMLF